MREEQLFGGRGGLFADNGDGALPGLATAFPRQAVIGGILVIALLAFEIFNFDSTRYALHNLLGDVSFVGLRWASILALAFCAIDFAGLAHLFTPERGKDEPKEVWYLMGAWLLGATMNAIMTWWAVSLTLLSHDFGNEVLSRGQLLQYVPPFVAVLVWLTRILFIGAFSVAGDHLFAPERAVAPGRERQATVPNVMNRRKESPASKPSGNGKQRPRVNRRPPAPGGSPRPVPSMSMSPRRQE